MENKVRVNKLVSLEDSLSLFLLNLVGNKKQILNGVGIEELWHPTSPIAITMQKTNEISSLILMCR